MPRFRIGYIPPPLNRNPLIKRLVDLMNQAGADSQELARQAGVSLGTINAWRTRTNPNITNLEAVLNVLGYELAIIKRKDV